jgi:plasmid stabilization system protein ParE
VKLWIGKRAQEQAAKIGQWWATHREAAPNLFIDELETTFRFLCSERGAGVRWPTPRRPTLRRILMPRSRNHVYFVVDEAADVIRVLAIWGAPRGKTPKL